MATSKITINGQTFEVEGDNVSIQSRNGTITINGKHSVDGLSGKVKVELPKEVNVGSVVADGDVDCGVVHGDVDAGGSVRCGNVIKNVDAGGSVNCQDIGGNADAGGSVNCGTVGGNVDAGGSVVMRK